MRFRRRPAYSLWIEGMPRSLSAEKKAGYMERVRQVAAQQVASPLRSGRLDIDIIFAAKDRLLRPDVDNIAKPILDALKGVIYDDDRQVRSVRIVAVPLDDASRFSGQPVTVSRLARADEFLVNVYEGLELDVWVGEAEKITPSASPTQPGDEPPAMNGGRIDGVR